jgi:hypothetical protein
MIFGEDDVLIDPVGECERLFSKVLSGADVREAEDSLLTQSAAFHPEIFEKVVAMYDIPVLPLLSDDLLYDLYPDHRAMVEAHDLELMAATGEDQGSSTRTL